MWHVALLSRGRAASLESEVYMKRLQVERLAYWLWQQRGMPIGSPEEDWFLAEELLKRRHKWLERSVREQPLFAFGIERRTA